MTAPEPTTQTEALDEYPEMGLPLAQWRPLDVARNIVNQILEKGLPNACACGDCFHPVIGPNTDGEPCDWCRDCGCPSADHTRTTSVFPPAVPTPPAADPEPGL